MIGIFSCKDCVPPERHLFCHSTCEKYIAEKKIYEEMKKKEKERLKNTSFRLNSNGTYFSGNPYTHKNKKYNKFNKS